MALGASLAVMHQREIRWSDVGSSSLAVERIDNLGSSEAPCDRMSRLCTWHPVRRSFSNTFMDVITAFMLSATEYSRVKSSPGQMTTVTATRQGWFQRNSLVMSQTDVWR
jgi:hypothetical protein